MITFHIFCTCKSLKQLSVSLVLIVYTHDFPQLLVMDYLESKPIKMLCRLKEYDPEYLYTECASELIELYRIFLWLSSIVSTYYCRYSSSLNFHVVNGWKPINFCACSRYIEHRSASSYYKDNIMRIIRKRLLLFFLIFCFLQFNGCLWASV